MKTILVLLTTVAVMTISVAQEPTRPSDDPVSIEKIREVKSELKDLYLNIDPEIQARVEADHAKIHDDLEQLQQRLSRRQEEMREKQVTDDRGQPNEPSPSTDGGAASQGDVPSPAFPASQAASTHQPERIVETRASHKPAIEPSAKPMPPRWSAEERRLLEAVGAYVRQVRREIEADYEARIAALQQHIAELESRQLPNEQLTVESVPNDRLIEEPLQQELFSRP